MQGNDMKFSYFSEITFTYLLFRVLSRKYLSEDFTRVNSLLVLALYSLFKNSLYSLLATRTRLGNFDFTRYSLVFLLLLDFTHSHFYFYSVLENFTHSHFYFYSILENFTHSQFYFYSIAENFTHSHFYFYSIAENFTHSYSIFYFYSSKIRVFTRV